MQGKILKIPILEINNKMVAGTGSECVLDSVSSN